jgi:hypothetical protein
MRQIRGVAAPKPKHEARRQRRFPSSTNGWAMGAATPPPAMSHGLSQVNTAVPSQLASRGERVLHWAQP